MMLWKCANLLLSAGILVLGIVTVVQFSILVWQPKNEENIQKFKALAIRFVVLMVLAVVMLGVTRLVRYLYLWGYFS